MVRSMLQAASPHIRDAIEDHASALKDLIDTVRDDDPVSVGAMLELARVETGARTRVLNAEAESFHDARLKVLYFAAVLVVTKGKFVDGETDLLTDDLARHAQ
jgi:hypothetical protein